MLTGILPQPIEHRTHVLDAAKDSSAGGLDETRARHAGRHPQQGIHTDMGAGRGADGILPFVVERAAKAVRLGDITEVLRADAERIGAPLYSAMRASAVLRSPNRSSSFLKLMTFTSSIGRACIASQSQSGHRHQ